MRKNVIRREFLFALVALLLAFVLVACEPAEEDPGLAETPILGVETPVFDETPVVVETAVVDETPMVEETPLVEETPIVDETPMVEETPLVDETPMVEETPLVDETPIVEETPDVSGVMTDTAGIVRSSTLIGLPIETADGEQVGEISDVLIDQQGAIQYIIFDAGGFLGIGERTSAVDWALFESDTQGTTDDGRVLLYVGEAADLETSPEIDAALLEEDDLILDAETLNLEAEFDSLIQVSEFGSGIFNLTGYSLVNAQDEDLGEIQELILDLTQGQVLYVVADIGGFLGIGANQIAMPWEQLQLDEENQNFVVDAEQETLENAPTINLDEWEEGSPTDTTWDTDIDDFWENDA